MAHRYLGKFDTFAQAKVALADHLLKEHTAYGQRYGSTEYVTVLHALATGPAWWDDQGLWMADGTEMESPKHYRFEFGGARWTFTRLSD